MEGGRLVDGRRPLVMASLTEVRAVPRTLLKVTFKKVTIKESLGHYRSFEIDVKQPPDKNQYILSMFEREFLLGLKDKNSL